MFWNPFYAEPTYATNARNEAKESGGESEGEKNVMWQHFSGQAVKTFPLRKLTEIKCGACF